MRLQDIHENYLVKHALEVALIGGHSVALQFTPDSKEITMDLQEWCREQNIPVLTIPFNTETNTDIKLKVFAPTKPDTRHWNEPDTAIFKRVSEAGNYTDKESTTTFDRLLVSATKTLQLNDVQKAQIVIVANSVSRLNRDGMLEAVHLAEALQYWQVN